MSEIVLNIEAGAFMLSYEEAMQVAEILCSCSRIDSTWKNGRTMEFIGGPNYKAASITPYTAIRRLDHESNAREMTEAKK